MADIYNLCSHFALSICTYSILHKRYQLVVTTHTDTANSWTYHQVIERWCQLFPVPSLIQRYHEGQPLNHAEMLMLTDRVQRYRSRLSNINWFMRCLHEKISITLNINNKTHLHWKGSYHAQQLIGQAALYRCKVNMHSSLSNHGKAGFIYSSVAKQIKFLLALANNKLIQS